MLVGCVACNQAQELSVGAAAASAEHAPALTPAEPPAPAPAHQAWSPAQAAPLRFLPAWQPEWHLELKTQDSVHLAALEQGVLLYRSGYEPYHQRPHTLVGGRLSPISGIGVVAGEMHERAHREFYGRWPDSLWRFIDGSDTHDPPAVSRWTGETWRPLAPFPAKCSVDHIGHTSEGGRLVTMDGCNDNDEPPYQVYGLGTGEATRLGPPLPWSPTLGLATPDALFLAIRLELPVPGESRQMAIARYPCAPPYDCPPEQFSLGTHLGVERWLDHNWARQAGGLVHRGGVSIVHQRGASSVEDYLLTHDGREWRVGPAPGRITALLAAPQAMIVVTLAPVRDAELANQDWPATKHNQHGDTLWLQYFGQTSWRPVRLPQEALLDLAEIQVAVDGEKLWLAAEFLAGPTRMFSTPLADIVRPAPE